MDDYNRMRNHIRPQSLRLQEAQQLIIGLSPLLNPNRVRQLTLWPDLLEDSYRMRNHIREQPLRLQEAQRMMLGLSALWNHQKILTLRKTWMTWMT